MKSCLILPVACSIAFAPSFSSAASTALSTTTHFQDTQVKDGTPANRKEYIEAVSIELYAQGKPAGWCTGVLIAPTIVLSAGHCAWNKAIPVRVSALESYTQAVKTQPSGVAKPPGKDYPQSAAVDSFEVMNSSAIDAGVSPVGSDLMLIRLAAPMEVPVRPIAIAQLAHLSDVKVVRVVGFGENGKKGFGTKLWADIDVAFPRCSPAAATEPSDALCAEGAELLARHPDKKFDTCPGDSGGPVYARGEGGDYYLVGITSRAPMPSQQCGGGTFVTLLDGDRLAWIKSIVPDVVVGPAFVPENAPKIQTKATKKIFKEDCEKSKPNPTC